MAAPPHHDSRRDDVLAPLASLVITATVLIALELAKLPWQRLTAEPVSSALGPASSLLWLGLFDHGLPVFGAQLFVFLLAARSWRGERLRLGAIVLMTVTTVVVFMYSELLEHSVFVGHVPLMAWHVVLLLGVWAGVSHHLGLGRTVRRAIVCAIAGIAIGALALVANYEIFPFRYPTFHIAMTSSAMLWLWMGFSNALFLLPARAKTTVFAVVLSLGCIVGGAAALSADPKPQLTAIVREYSVLGFGRLPEGNALDEPPCESPTETFSEGAALSSFDTHSGLPDLPAGFRLDDYNLLFILTDTLRYDQTSAARPDLDTTPNLSRFVDRGAFHFTRAYSPSAATGPVMCSVFAMTYPSHAPMKVAKRAPWRVSSCGGDRNAVAQLSAAGYDTFAVVHLGVNNCGGALSVFDTFEVFQHQRMPTMDAGVADAAIRNLRAREDERFFGWVFFLSPHDPYLDRGTPDAPPIDRYRGEIRYADEQLGRVLDALGDRGLEKTIVVFSSDHGEEFGEHGRHHHGQTLYSTSIHVPLTIWIPGVKGTTIDRPTSLTYLFPWLFLHGDGPLRKRAVEVLREDIGPMMDRTDGGVVSEILQLGKMKVALTYDRFRIHHRMGIESHELYDLNVDPDEKRDVFYDDADSAQLYAKRLDAYLRQRACQRRYRIGGH